MTIIISGLASGVFAPRPLPLPGLCFAGGQSPHSPGPDPLYAHPPYLRTVATLLGSAKVGYAFSVLWFVRYTVIQKVSQKISNHIKYRPIFTIILRTPGNKCPIKIIKDSNIPQTRRLKLLLIRPITNVPTA